ncbi:MAG: hypothetical protein Q7J80_01815, partial [Anaerolineales bacterium]|nr:hypothetical protein [Anaerolineales bacterium]
VYKERSLKTASFGAGFLGLSASSCGIRADTGLGNPGCKEPAQPYPRQSRQHTLAGKIGYGTKKIHKKEHQLDPILHRPLTPQELNVYL